MERSQQRSTDRNVLEAEDASRTDGAEAMDERPRPASTQGMRKEEGLLPDDSLSRFQQRWEAVQTGFVDDPRAAVRDAEALVNDMVDRLTDVFTKERRSLEDAWNRGDQASTEDLRVALQRYRSFFGKLLAV